MSDPAATMVANLEARTGRSLADWVAVVRETGLDKHGAIVGHLKTVHGLSHGYANLIALTHLREGEPEGEDLVHTQYRGKENLRPVYDAIVTAVTGFGDDVELAPKKTGVSLRRAKQFALITPASRSRVDLGINIRHAAPSERLVEVGGMCTHKVAVTDAGEVDAQLIEWLRVAYEQAGRTARG